MAGELAAVVKDMLDAIDRNDAEGVLRNGADEVQGIDEISRRWMRGLEAVGEYVRGLVTQVEDVRSEMRDVHETVWGDVGLVTFWLEQDYVLEGERHHVSAPSSAVLRRDGGPWQLVLFHSIPLPEEAGS
jgi:ketosteroid isomerase-like protein